jgi:hypothetical protein
MTSLLALALMAPASLPVGVTLAEIGGEPAATRAWVERRLAVANAIFEPHDLRFEIAWIRSLANLPARTVTRQHRHAYAPHAVRGVINVFVTPHLDDIHEPGVVRRGVHWRASRPKGRHYVIVAGYSGPAVLAHELGHFLGHARHTDVLDNLMSYKRSGGAQPTLTGGQGRAMRRRARRMFRTGALKRKTAPPRERRLPAFTP